MAVAHVHRHGFWPRYIKPKNIPMMTETFIPDATVLVDFEHCGC
jgi:hypothetical protein